MEEAEKKLIERFYQEFWIFLILLILMTVITIFLIIVYFIKIKKIGVRFKILNPIICLFFSIMSVVIGFYFSKYFKDLSYVKANALLYVEGKVIGHSVSSSGDDLTVTKSWPIILVSETNEKITLNILKSEEQVKVNEEYGFLYLPNTKIAEIVEKYT